MALANIQPFGWIDTRMMLSNLSLRYWEALVGAGDIQTLPLRDPDGNLPILEGSKKFGSALTLLARFRSQAAAFMEGKPADLAAAWVEVLQPEGSTPWTRNDDPEFLQFRICLASPPGAFLFCGDQKEVIGVGIINLINTAMLCSSVNAGTAPRIHLVINVRRPPPPEA